MTKYHIDGDIDFVETRKAHNKKGFANQKDLLKLIKTLKQTLTQLK